MPPDRVETRRRRGSAPGRRPAGWVPRRSLAGDVRPDGQARRAPAAAGRARAGPSRASGAGTAGRASRRCRAAPSRPGPRRRCCSGASRAWTRAATRDERRGSDAPLPGQCRSKPVGGRVQVGVEAHPAAVRRLRPRRRPRPAAAGRARRGRGRAARNAHSRPGRSSRMYGPGIEVEARPRSQPGGQAAGLGPRLEHADARSPRRASRSAAVRPPMPAPMTTTRPAHRVVPQAEQRLHRAAAPSRSSGPRASDGGNACSSISGTNSAPRPLPRS